jgi:hypothetical protein
MAAAAQVPGSFTDKIQRCRVRVHGAYPALAFFITAQSPHGHSFFMESENSENSLVISLISSSR